jgi:hypothetical protein
MEGMRPDAFFAAFTEPDYEAWMEDRSSVRLAFHAALSAAQLTDHYFMYYHCRNDPKSFNRKRDEFQRFVLVLEQRAPEFRVIRAMSNAFKRLYTWEQCEIASTGVIYALDWDSHGATEDSETIDPEHKGDVIVRRRDGSEANFSILLPRVIEMWKTLLSESAQHDERGAASIYSI